MSWLSSFLSNIFNKDSLNLILKLGLQLLKIFIGKISDDLLRIAKEEVWKAEQTNKTGTEKYEMAYKAIKARLPEVKESIVNLAIEISVGWLSQARG